MPKIAIPTGQAELEELLSDGSQVNALMREGQFTDVIKAYAKHVVDNDQDMARQVKEETQRVLAEYLKENGNDKGLERLKQGGQESVVRRAKDLAVFNPKALGAQIEDVTDGTMGDFFNTIWHKNEGRPGFAEKQDRLRNAAASSGEPASGGFLVPESLRSELLRVALESSVVRPLARVVPMETSRVMYPTVDSTSNVSSVHGGIVAYWTPESGQMTDVAASFGRVALEAWKLTAFANVPNELISDSMISFEAFINTAFPEALSYYEDDAFINGSGAGQPKGFLNADAAVEVAKESGQLADTILWENIVKAYSRMLPASLGRAVWIVSPDVFPELATMALSVGTGGSAIWLNNGVVGPPMTILGRPVIVSEKVPALGNAGDVNFVDLGYYLIGDRQAITAESSPHYRFQNGETSFKIVSRVDGRPWLQSAITPKNSGPTLSPFVKIAERA